MKERQAWEQFLATGKVEDYLACVGKASDEEKNSGKKADDRTVRNEEVKCRSL
jgi:hypothetical protein